MSNSAHRTWAGTLLICLALYITVWHGGSWAAATTAGIGGFLILMAMAPENRS